VRKLNESGKNSILSLSKDLTETFLIRYSDFFDETKESNVKGIALKEGVTVEALIEEFRGIIPYELLEAFLSTDALSKLASTDINSSLLCYIADHNERPIDFIYALHNATNVNFDDDAIMSYLREYFGYYCSEEVLKNAIAQYREERA
jgi:hypothetical protein